MGLLIRSREQSFNIQQTVALLITGQMQICCRRLKVVYSKELPAVLQRLEKTEQGKPVPGSCAFVPSVAGLILAGEVIKDLTGLQAHF